MNPRKGTILEYLNENTYQPDNVSISGTDVDLPNWIYNQGCYGSLKKLFGTVVENEQLESCLRDHKLSLENLCVKFTSKRPDKMVLRIRAVFYCLNCESRGALSWERNGGEWNDVTRPGETVWPVVDGGI